MQPIAQDQFRLLVAGLSILCMLMAMGAHWSAMLAKRLEPDNPALFNFCRALVFQGMWSFVVAATTAIDPRFWYDDFLHLSGFEIAMWFGFFGGMLFFFGLQIGQGTLQNGDRLLSALWRGIVGWRRTKRRSQNAV